MSYILITGASSGIGLNLSIEYAKRNNNLILISRNIDKLNEIKNQFNNVDIITIKYDLTLDLSNLFNIIKELNLDIKLVINNAGFGIVSEFINSNIKKDNELINLNVLALTRITHYFLINSNAKIINISSVASMYPGVNMSLYYASKTYVTSFSRGIEKENRGRVKVINLPKIETNFDNVAGKRKNVKKGMKINPAIKKIIKAINNKKVVNNIGIATKFTVLISKLFHRSFLLNLSNKTNEIQQ